MPQTPRSLTEPDEVPQSVPRRASRIAVIIESFSAESVPSRHSPPTSTTHHNNSGRGVRPVSVLESLSGSIVSTRYPLHGFLLTLPWPWALRAKIVPGGFDFCIHPIYSSAEANLEAYGQVRQLLH